MQCRMGIGMTRSHTHNRRVQVAPASGQRRDDVMAQEIAREAHVRIAVVLDPLLSRRSGYLLIVNANGARWDALLENGRSEGPEPQRFLFRQLCMVFGKTTEK